jgi:hypothetical protein
MNKQELHPVQLELLNKYGFDHQLFEKLPEEMEELIAEICTLVHLRKVGAIWIDEDGIKVVDPEFEIGVERFCREFVDMEIVFEQVKSMLDQEALARYREEALSKAKTKYL